MRSDEIINKAHSLPAEFRRIRLELAREPGHPEGDRRIGYTIVAPLKTGGHLDAPVARAYRHDCAVVRFRDGADPEHGHLRRRPGGSWSFHYELPDESEDDDATYRLDQHRFLPGEYVTVSEDEGDHTYRVVSVEAL